MADEAIQPHGRVWKDLHYFLYSTMAYLTMHCIVLSGMEFGLAEAQPLSAVK